MRNFSASLFLLAIILVANGVSSMHAPAEPEEDITNEEKMAETIANVPSEDAKNHLQGEYTLADEGGDGGASSHGENEDSSIAHVVTHVAHLQGGEDGETDGAIEHVSHLADTDDEGETEVNKINGYPNDANEPDDANDPAVLGAADDGEASGEEEGGGHPEHDNDNNNDEEEEEEDDDDDDDDAHRKGHAEGHDEHDDNDEDDDEDDEDDEDEGKPVELENEDSIEDEAEELESGDIKDFVKELAKASPERRKEMVNEIRDEYPNLAEIADQALAKANREDEDEDEDDEDEE